MHAQMQDAHVQERALTAERLNFAIAEHPEVAERILLAASNEAASPIGFVRLIRYLGADVDRFLDREEDRRKGLVAVMARKRRGPPQAVVAGSDLRTHFAALMKATNISRGSFTEALLEHLHYALSKHVKSGNVNEHAEQMLRSELQRRDKAAAQAAAKLAAETAAAAADTPAAALDDPDENNDEEMESAPRATPVSILERSRKTTDIQDEEMSGDKPAVPSSKSPLHVASPAPQEPASLPAPPAATPTVQYDTAATNTGESGRN